MMSTRYAVGARLADGRRTLELACGAGVGLGLVGARAAALVGGDVSAALLARAQAHYAGRYPLARLDAATLPFRDGAFDAVLCFEAIYYLPKVPAALDEVARVLAPAGVVLLVSANPDRRDFIPSPYSTNYFSGDALRAELEARGFTVTVDGAFPVQRGGRTGTVVPVLRRVLAALRLVPRTLRGRARLKRLVDPTLAPLPAELHPRDAVEETLVPIREAGQAAAYKVIYVTGRKRP